MVTIGSWVHFVLDDGDREGDHRPALVVETEPLVLTVFLRKGDDDRSGVILLQPEDVPYDEAGLPGTWHWPETTEI